MPFLRSIAARIVPLGLLGALLAGCSNTGEDALRPEIDYPVVTSSRLVSEAVEHKPVRATAAANEKRQLDAFVLDYIRSGGGPFVIRIGHRPDAREAAEAESVALRRYVVGRGLRQDEVVIELSEEREAVEDLVVVSYERYTVRLPTCGDESKSTGFNPDNTHHSNLGCSTQRNLAAMVSNPADLVRMRRPTPADNVRRSLVLQNYRLGQPTESVTEVEPSTLSDVATE